MWATDTPKPTQNRIWAGWGGGVLTSVETGLDILELVLSDVAVAMATLARIELNYLAMTPADSNPVRQNVLYRRH